MQQDELPLAVRMLVAGTSACIADVATFPLDTAKVRLQVQGEAKAPASGSGGVVQQVIPKLKYKGTAGTVLTIAREEGVRCLYNGLAAGLQRQMCFASVRIGYYDTVKAFYTHHAKNPSKGSPIDILVRCAAGITTGCMAVLVAQPTDVVKVRFQAQLKGEAQRYTGTLHAYKVIGKTEGIVNGLYKGMLPNAARNAIVNVGEIVVYDAVKDFILTKKLMEDNVPCHFTAAVLAGFAATVIASPVDVIKTRYMNAPLGKYKGAIDCAISTVKKEGAKAFYKGFIPSFTRLVSWNICMWITYEQMKRLAVKAYNSPK